jgi:AraC-like DNA-binding protein
MDLLSKMLSGMTVEATVICQFNLLAPWCLDTASWVPKFVPALPAYSFSVVEGSCWLAWDRHAPVLLKEGDSVLCPGGAPFRVSSTMDVAPTPFEKIWSGPYFTPHHPQDFPARLDFGGDGPKTRLLSIAFGFPEGYSNPLLSALPAVLILSQGHNLMPWLKSAIDFLSQEESSTRPGYAVISTHLANLIFLSLIRSYVLQNPNHIPCWIQGLSDPRIARALTSFHSNPRKNLTLESLSRDAGMSRSAFTKQFAELVGQSPGKYIVAWRMHLAKESLISGIIKPSALAETVGYRSERAFRSAFKAATGLSPAIYRRESMRAAEKFS